ncbi:archease [candidate division KSB1 bacterium]|nr:archease [candidate division KSB1 bacterium]NIR71047.1 archease [candidate division KSB1 bacterium]NIS24753.1 archease [candidate division KSB1 bacterium]NIT71658.1 archease [candidate division KSB1 bacterium]NIU25365.1 archease [candidate division KSB1 bacterium]
MTRTSPKFEHIDHTADVGIKVYGSELSDLFTHAALGLFDIIANLEKVSPNLDRSITVEADDREALLVRWLSELNYLFFTEREIYKEFEITEIAETRLVAIVRGEKLDYERHEIYTEVKAVTYHRLYIKETECGWEAQVIFDL